MDVYPTILKDDQPLIATEESENDGYQTSEIGDKVADWMAKAYGSKNRKRSYYDPQEKVNIFIRTNRELHFNFLFRFQRQNSYDSLRVNFVF